MARARLVGTLLCATLAGWTARQARNGIRRLVGRPRRGADNAAVWALLRHWAGRRPIAAISAIDKGAEGGCSQALSMILARALAAALGLPYAHSPFRDVAHADRPMAEWEQAWERLFNLGDGAPAASAMSGPVLDVVGLFASDAYGPWLLRRLSPWVAAQRDDLRARYAGGRAIRPERAGDGPARQALTVAIHVRRGDVSPRAHAHMWTDPEIVAQSARQVREVLGRRGIACRLVLVTQGKAGELAGLIGGDVEVLADGDPMASFDVLAGADVLVMAKSSFSYVAALLSRGVVAASANFYPALPGWVPVGGDGRFDPDRFVAAVDRSLQDR